MPKRRELDPKPLLDINLLKEAFEDNGVNSKHATTVLRYFIQKNTTDFSTIPDFPKKALKIIYEQFVPLTSKLVEKHDSSDRSTTKMLIELQCGRKIESVIMRYGDVELRSFPEQEKRKIRDNLQVEDDTSSLSSTSKRFKSNRRATLCVSSQVGCLMGCTFCATGTMGLVDNLLAGEILEQLYHAKKFEKIRNIVFMGMGEPLDNYEAVYQAVQAMIDPSRFQLSASRISISTVGVVPKILRMKRDMPEVCLALSLHAPTQDLRIKIVPTAKAWHVERIFEAADDFILHQNEVLASKTYTRHLSSLKKDREPSKRKLLLEYVLLGPKLNCSEEVAHQMGKLLASSSDRLAHCILNVIPYNPTDAGERFGYVPPTQEVINNFVGIVRSYGASVLVRQELGQDVNAACGQLAVKQCDGDIEDMGRPSSKAKARRSYMIKRGKKSEKANDLMADIFAAKAARDSKHRRLLVFLIFLTAIISTRLVLKYLNQIKN